MELTIAYGLLSLPAQDAPAGPQVFSFNQLSMVVHAISE